MAIEPSELFIFGNMSLPARSSHSRTSCFSQNSLLIARLRSSAKSSVDSNHPQALQFLLAPSSQSTAQPARSRFPNLSAVQTLSPCGHRGLIQPRLRKADPVFLSRACPPLPPRPSFPDKNATVGMMLLISMFDEFCDCAFHDARRILNGKRIEEFLSTLAAFEPCDLLAARAFRLDKNAID